MREAEEHGWLASEEDVARRLTAALERKLKSRSYIEAQLRKKRLPLPEPDGEVEAEKARALLERKFGSVQEMTFEERGKAYRFLKYRGFHDRWIRQVLNEKP
ncbi:MAG: RecX family transcriptional regulator [Calothrix sp. SM1_5_4]|nr:RecX family transcriptional regulator [Calothrix sp. SM1_5_4]